MTPREIANAVFLACLLGLITGFGSGFIFALGHVKCAGPGLELEEGVMKERITLLAEHIEDGQVTHAQTAVIEQHCLKPEDIWLWLPDAFRAIGYLSMGDSLSAESSGEPTS